MVQLRSFRYFGAGEAPLEGERDELSVSNRSSQSISTLTGGNLTSSDSNSSGSNQQFELSKIEKQQANENEAKEIHTTDESISSTLSSSQEYQVANHEISEEEEVVGAGGRGQPVEPDTERHEQTPDESGEIRSSPQMLPAAQRQQFTPVTPRATPVGSRWHNIANNSPSLNAIHRQHHLMREQQSPRITGNKFGTMVSGANSETQSRYSSQTLTNQNQQATNHFEVRWRNLHLYARRSKPVSKLIADNPIYKLFKKSNEKDQLEADDKIYYSPPVNHKKANFTLGTGNLPPVGTISEELETGGPGKVAIESSQLKEPTMDEWMSEQQASAGPEYRSVLTNISGSVFSGQLTAVLGPSGVGKTMLLNSLTGRNTLDGTGRVQLLGGASKRVSVVTVPQADVLPGRLTALEDLQLTSRLKNPSSGFDHERNISRIVKHLHMEKFLHTRIEKLSGGEARRLSIGRELLNSPDIMILDEPTSGLDANTCKKIITALRDIVEHSDNILDKPMAIIVTIHQPQQEVLNLFHRAYVIALGGRAIYEGSPTDLMATLLEQSSLGRVCNIDQINENPAIVALEVASGEYGPSIIAELALNHENQVYYEETDELAGSPWLNGPTLANSPYSTPRQLRSPRKSPLSVSPLFDLLHRTGGRRHLSDSPLGTRHTPIMAALANKRAAAATAAASQIDRESSVTSFSYASTYDADLPEVTSRLKVDKRLRRSVVMKSAFISHTLTLMKRCWLLTTRDVTLMAIRIIGFLLVAGGIVQIFRHALDPNEHQCPAYRSEIDDVITYMKETKDKMLNLQRSIQQFSSTHLYFFHLILCMTMVVSALSGLVFPLQMRMFIREYKNGWYSPASFITSQTLAELPIDLIGPILTIAIAYPLSNQPTSEYHWRECGYMIIFIFNSIICKSVAQIVGALLMNSVENSVFISCVAVTPSALLSGVAVRISQMSKPLQLLSYGSFIRYTFEGLFVVRYGYNICPCDPEIIDGYPVRTSLEAMPPQLDNLARGFIELFTPTTTTTTLSPLLKNSTRSPQALQPTGGEGEIGNLYVRFIQLVTDAANRFVPNSKHLGDCAKYRSLALMDQEIEDYVLPKYLLIMAIMFAISRIITYFVVKLVIRLQDKR